MFISVRVFNPFSILQVHYSPEKGRHVVATQNIEGGQVISVDPEPLVFLIFDPTQGIGSTHVKYIDYS